MAALDSVDARLAVTVFRMLLGVSAYSNRLAIGICVGLVTTKELPAENVENPLLPGCFHRADDEIRTRDPHLGKAMEPVP
jgi:hypothetical protein